MSSNPVTVTFKPTSIQGVIAWVLTNNTNSPVLAALVRGASCPQGNGSAILVPPYVFGGAYWANYIYLGVKFQVPPFSPDVRLGLIASPNGVQMGFVFYIPPNSSVVVDEEVFNCTPTDYYPVLLEYVETRSALIGYDPKLILGYPSPGYLPNPKLFHNVPVFMTLENLPPPPVPISGTDYRWATTTVFTASVLLALGKHWIGRAVPVIVSPP